MRVKIGLCALALFHVCGCGAASIAGADAQPPSGGGVSLQTAPYDANGEPAHVTPQSPANSSSQQQAAGDVPDFTSIAANFDPRKQHFIWVLPPGVHGEGPWGFTVQVRHKGDVKHEGELPLVAEKLAGGSQPEFPAGYEVVRLKDDGQWLQRTAALDQIIRDIIEQYGRGDGEVEFNSLLKVSLDPAARQKYCVEHQVADIRSYLEDESEPDLIMLLNGRDPTFSALALKSACEE